MLKVEHLTKSYNHKKVVDDLSFDIKNGEIYGFIGHNGAGKTTTIKAIAGILPFDEGNIEMNGLSFKEHMLDCKKEIAYIPDNPDLYEYLTGIQYLNFISDVYQVSTNDREKTIHKYAHMFEMTQNLSQSIQTYSHGMKQKLALISAFIHQPQFIIMDEPFVGLDPKASHTLKKLMKEHCQNGGSIFFSTHVLEVAEKLCDRIAIIKKGKLIVEGKTEDVIGNDSLEDVFLELGDENA